MMQQEDGPETLRVLYFRVLEALLTGDARAMVDKYDT